MGLVSGGEMKRIVFKNGVEEEKNGQTTKHEQDMSKGIFQKEHILSQKKQTPDALVELSDYSK